MGYLYKQEMYKLFKKRSNFILIGLLILQNTVAVLMGQHVPVPEDQISFFINDFGNTYFIGFVLISAAATIISSEFEYNTIKNLLNRQFTRKQVLISKWLTILTYTIFSFVLMLIVTAINKMIFYPQINIFHQVPHGHMAIWQLWLLTTLGSFVAILLILSAVIFISVAIKKSAMAVAIGTFGYFSVPIISSVLSRFFDKWGFLKWNPFNMMNLEYQLTDSTFSQFSGLSTVQLSVGTAVYLILFLVLGLYFFSKKEV